MPHRFYSEFTHQALWPVCVSLCLTYLAPGTGKALPIFSGPLDLYWVSAACQLQPFHPAFSLSLASWLAKPSGPKTHQAHQAPDPVWAAAFVQFPAPPALWVTDPGSAGLLLLCFDPWPWQGWNHTKCLPGIPNCPQSHNAVGISTKRKPLSYNSGTDPSFDHKLLFLPEKAGLPLSFQGTSLLPGGQFCL